MKRTVLFLLLTFHSFQSYLSAQALVPISAGINSLGSNPNSVAKLRDHLYVFRASSTALGDEPYVTDGTQTGTFLLKDINPGNEPSGGNANDDMFHRINDTLSLFAANDGNTNHGSELWRTNGDSSGTYMVADLVPGPSASNIIFSTAQFSNKLFLTSDSSYWVTLWVTDGISQNTIPLLKRYCITNAYFNRVVAVANGLAYFYTAQAADSIFLWRTDGTVNGTIQLMKINTSIGNFFSGLTIATDYIFPAVDSVHGYKLWKTDGTVAGTALLKDLDSNTVNSAPHAFTSLGNKILFQYYADDREAIWVTDGTSSGTFPLGDSSVFPLYCYSYIAGTSDSSAFFALFDYYANTNSIWETDGTIAGTVLLHTFPLDYSFSSYNNFVKAYGLTFFVIEQNEYFWAYGSIWATDGTESGTYEVYANPDEEAVPIWELTGVCDQVFCDMIEGYNYEDENLWAVTPNNAYDANLFANTSEQPLIYLVDDGAIFFTAIDSVNAELYKLEVCPATPVQNNSSSNSLTLFPNPNDGLFSIQLPGNLMGAEIRIDDMTGRNIYPQKIFSSSGSKLNLHLEYLPAGAYLLQVSLNEKYLRQIFIKQ